MKSLNDMIKDVVYKEDKRGFSIYLNERDATTLDTLTNKYNVSRSVIFSALLRLHEDEKNG